MKVTRMDTHDTTIKAVCNDRLFEAQSLKKRNKTETCKNNILHIGLFVCKYGAIFICLKRCQPFKGWHLFKQDCYITKTVAQSLTI